MCLTASIQKLASYIKTTFSTTDHCFVWRLHHAESHGLMDLNYTDVKLDLSGFTVKGRREGAQMVFGSDTEVHIWCCDRYPRLYFNIPKRKTALQYMIKKTTITIIWVSNTKVTLFFDCCRINLIPLSGRDVVTCSVFINLMTKCLQNVIENEIYLLGQEAAECPALSQPIRRLPADFLCLASSIRAPCQFDWAEGHG